MFKRAYAFILIVLVSLFVSFALAEIASRYAFFTKLERTQGAKNLFKQTQNSYVSSLNTSNDGCGFVDLLTPHPYLAFVRHNVPPCGDKISNNIGIQQDIVFPHEREKEYFSLFLIGGSVAAQLSYKSAKSGVSYLEEILNKRYKSPNGKPFRVLSGANGSWNFPLQINALTLYGDSVDAVVAIDGYNEAIRASFDLPITNPDTFIYLTVAKPQLMGGFSDLIMLLKRMHLLGVNSILGDSFLFLSAYRRVTAMVFSPANEAAQKHAISRYFDLPKSWNKNKIKSWNKNKYESYLKLLRAQANAFSIPYIHFVQPIPGIAKKLTNEEKAITVLVDANFYKETIIDASTSAKRAGVFSYSLQDVFAKEENRIFADDIHCIIDNGESYGYRLMTEEMVKKIAATWKLQAR